MGDEIKLAELDRKIKSLVERVDESDVAIGILKRLLGWTYIKKCDASSFSEQAVVYLQQIKKLECTDEIKDSVSTGLTYDEEYSLK